MRARTIGGWLVGVFAGLCALTNAEASLVKSKGSPPLVMPNTLLVEAGERLGPAPAALVPKLARTVADAKRSPQTCAAVAVKVPHQGTRIVTARHCADHRSLEIMDADHAVRPVGQIDSPTGVDLSVLEIAGDAPWSGLTMRSAASVATGERLCAWRMHRDGERIVRERICARLTGRKARPGVESLLIMSHPYPAGTSGSALVDRRGRVVGIVVASTGLAGLAEPIEGVLRVPVPAPRIAGDTASEPPR